MRQHLILSVMMALFITASNSTAKEDCPSARQLIESDIPTGFFAMTAWELYDTKGRGEDYSNTILLFSEEEFDGETIHVKGYFWWWRNGNKIGCSKFEGNYNIATRKLTLRRLGVSSQKLASKIVYHATLSADKKTIIGTWNGEHLHTTDSWDGKYSCFVEWKAMKIGLTRSYDKTPSH